MKAIITVIMFSLAGMLGLTAQDLDMSRMERMSERIEAQKVAFITNQLALTAEESAQFWPIYNEYKAKEKEKRRSVHPGKELQYLTDAEAEELFSKSMQIEEELVDLKREYFVRMKEVLSARKIVRLQHLEREFNLQVLNKLRQARQGKGQPRN